ncbi:helix-turn-helix domain-containing protein [Patescibacteria group bacterium]|nr:helix-turn-helix domain-containing protein [Patescibacteria group bacterium]
MVFKKRLIPEGNIFKKLQSIRTKKGISLETIGKETKIPIKHLRALEGGSIKMLPDILYTKNIIKKYLSFFNVDPGPFIAVLDLKRNEKQSPSKALGMRSLVVMPRIIKTAIALVLIVGFITYLGFSISKIFRPPTIIIYTPQEGEIVRSNIIAVNGKTDKGTAVLINNEQVLLNQEEEFNKEINLQKGLNLIKISGINRYSKENVIWRNVILEIE